MKSSLRANMRALGRVGNWPGQPIHPPPTPSALPVASEGGCHEDETMPRALAAVVGPLELQFTNERSNAADNATDTNTDTNAHTAIRLHHHFTCECSGRQSGPDPDD